MKSYNKKKIILNSVFVIAILISLFLLYEHFAEGSQICNFGKSLDCGVVNKSPYANLDGISYWLTIDLNLPIKLIDISSKNLFLNFITTNAFLSILVFLFLLYLLNKENAFGIKKEKKAKIIKTILTLSFLYGMYLVYIQHSVLQTYCVFCLALDATIITGLITSWLK